MDRAPQDLTLAQEQLEKLGDAYESLVATLDASGDGIVAIREDRRSVFFNVTLAELWNLPQDALATLDTESLLALQLQRVKDPASWLSHVQRRRANPELEEFSVVELLDGRVLERHVRPHRMHGRTVGSVITFRDITERVRYEDRMVFNHLVLENSGPMLWVDADTRTVTYANPAAARVLGYSVAELTGLHVNAFDPDYTEELRVALESAVAQAGRPLPFERVYTRRDGSCIDVESTVFTTSRSGRTVYIVSVKDLTAQKRIEHERLAHEAMLACVINSVPDPIFYKDHDGRYVGCNDAYASMVGRPREEVIGRTAADLFPRELAQNIARRDRATLFSLQKRSSEDGIVFPNGRRVLYETVVSPLWDENGEARGLLGICRNITERKRQEEEIRHAKELAEEATRMKSHFLANMSHEIRTPMNAIIGLSHLVLKTELSGRQRDYIEKVQSSGQHLLGIINDILDFSKVEAGKLELENADFPLEKLLDNTSSLISEKCHAKGLELVFEVAPDVPTHLVGDSLRLGQILLNYANNAVKFTEKGEVLVSVRASERTASDVLLHFRVKDTGIGLTKDQIGRLFQSFSQADATTTRRFGGTGLGLAICKRLAELMGGEVGVDSELGRGSTFWFSARVGIGRASERELLPKPDLRGRRALVVDDNDHAREAIVDMLHQMTFEVDEASDGSVALQLVRSAAADGRAYDVVYLDWRMPGMDGIECARRIKSLGLDAPPLLLMVTAYGREEMMKEAARVGVGNVLVKPVNPSILFDTTMNVLGARREAGAPPAAGASASADHRLAALRGRRVLLVEDNDINQQVARELLEDGGLVVDVADNGEVALERLRSNAYDLVFMDMQMPVMDGIEATVAIRAQPRLAMLPVIAMTANAMPQDRQRCLDAGMNDFLVKPIDPPELWAMLLRWARGPAMQPPPMPAAGPAPLPRPAAPPPPGVGMLEGIDGLDIALGLSRMAGKKSLYLAMLRRFADGQRGAGTQIRDALAAGDRATAERIAHTVKGVAGNIGATGLQAQAGALEGALRAGEPEDEARLRLVELEIPLAQLVAQLDARLPAPASA